MNRGKKGDWVKIAETVLKSEERSENLPEETKQVELKMWVKGFLQSDAAVGESVEVTTKTGRRVVGVLEEINPTYTISFGDYIPELSQIGSMAKATLREGDE